MIRGSGPPGPRYNPGPFVVQGVAGPTGPTYADPYAQWQDRHSGVMKLADPEMVEFTLDLAATTVQAIEKGLKDARIVPGQEISPRAAAVRNEIMELVTARMALLLSNLILEFDSFAFNARARGRKE